MTKKKQISFPTKIIIIIIVLAAFFIILDPIAIHEYINNQHHMYVTELKGSSMYPNIRDGELGVVLIKEAPDYNLEIGDVAVFYHEQADCMVGHRVVLITEKFVYTKGDNNDYVDPPVEKTFVVGELVDHIPEYHFVKRWLAESILEL